MGTHRPTLLTAAELHRLGDAIIIALYHGASLAHCGLLAPDDVFLAAAMKAPLTPEAAFALVGSWVEAEVDTGDLTTQTANRLAQLQRRLVKFLVARDATDIRDADRDAVLLWVSSSHATRHGIRRPSARTISNRLWAAESFFATLRRLDAFVGHPLLDVVRPVRPGARCRPLTDIEVDRARRFAPRSLSDTRTPAAFAIVEAGAATGEMMTVTYADATARPGHLYLVGDRRHLARWVPLTPTGQRAIERRLKVVASDPATPLVYEGAGSKESQQASACKAIEGALRRAGLCVDPLVKPASLRAWAGLSAFVRTGDITAAAALLGCRSLDDAAAIIAWEPEAAPEPPAHRRPR